MPRFVLLVVLVLTSSCDSTSYEDVPAEHTKLAGDLPSFSKPAEIAARIGVQESTWNILERTETPRRGRRPRYSVLRASVDDFEIDAIPGRLEMMFFNDRLARTTFHPKDMNALLSNLGRRFPTLKNDLEARAAPFTRISWRKSYAEVSWEDTRLTAQMRLWISRYS